MDERGQRNAKHITDGTEEIVTERPQQTQAAHAEHPSTNLPAKHWPRLGDAAVAALVSGIVSMVLFTAHNYLYWPLERERLVVDIQKTAEEVALAKMNQELTAAQTMQSKSQRELERIGASLKEVEQKYAERFHIFEQQAKIQQNELMKIQIYLLSIDEKTRRIREESAVTRETVEAAGALTSLLQSVMPNMKVESDVQITPNQYNKVQILSNVTNNGQYSFILSISINVFDENDNNISVNPVLEGSINPSGLLLSGQTISGNITIVFPKEWVNSRPGITKFVVSYRAETSPDVLDSISRNIKLKNIMEQMKQKSTFTNNVYSQVNFR
jgi:hypothetical protein